MKITIGLVVKLVEKKNLKDEGYTDESVRVSPR